MDPRLNRLRRDHEKLRELAARSHFVSISDAKGNPPYRYTLKLTCKGITGLKRNNKPIFAETFFLRIDLVAEYPRKGPTFQILANKTPVFHPNIGQSGLVCIGDEGDHGWSPAMGLDDVVVRIIRMIRYENVGFRSPFNEIAAKWAKKNQRLFPLDVRQIVGQAIPDIIIIDEGDRDLLGDIRIW